MSDKTTAYTEQPATEVAPAQHEPSLGFWGVGIALNLIVITAYFVWAYKQAKKKREKDE